MALTVLPVVSDIASYTFIVDLDGTLFRLGFKFNSRMDKWIMDVTDADGNDIVVGRPLFSNLAPLRYFVQESLPDGTILPINLNEDFVDAGEDDFGDFVKLYYNEVNG